MFRKFILKILSQDLRFSMTRVKFLMIPLKNWGGSIDMRKVMKISEAIGVEQCHVEQDQSSDPIKSIYQSISHLHTL